MPSSIESVLIVGANSGLGKEAARQIALRNETKLVVLGCRSTEKADAAKEELESSTGKHFFQIMILDTTKIPEIKEAVTSLETSIDAVILNAGGIVKNAESFTDEGVRVLFAANVLGHVCLVNNLIEQGKLKSTVVYASTESARGIPSFGAEKPVFEESSVAEFIRVAKGEDSEFDKQKQYGAVKAIGTWWMSAMSRKYTDLKFVSVSPGFTSGTSAFDSAPVFLKFIVKLIVFPLFRLLGKAHDVTDGANRYLDVLYKEEYESGKFYASSKKAGATGPLVDQGIDFPEFENVEIQDNAYEAVNSFL